MKMKKIIILLALILIIGGCKSQKKEEDYISYLRNLDVENIPEPSPLYGSLLVFKFQEIALHGDKQWGKIFDDPKIKLKYKERILEEIRRCRLKKIKCQQKEATNSGTPSQ